MSQVFDIDVSGKDLLSKNYTICIANKEKLIRGFKFEEGLINTLCSRFGQNQYRYLKSKKGKINLKVRIYCIIIYYLFKSLNLEGEISLNICRDFIGKETDIRENLKFFLEKNLGLVIDKRFYFAKLLENSNAHKYSFLMRHDTKNILETYVKVNLEDIEKWLK
jgi:hypothetical protein